MDLDLGNYERFLDSTLTRDNNLTTGKIYQVCLVDYYLNYHLMLEPGLESFCLAFCSQSLTRKGKGTTLEELYRFITLSTCASELYAGSNLAVCLNKAF